MRRIDDSPVNYSLNAYLHSGQYCHEIIALVGGFVVKHPFS